jgi:hypothetical protein
MTGKANIPQVLGMGPLALVATLETYVALIWNAKAIFAKPISTAITTDQINMSQILDMGPLALVATLEIYVALILNAKAIFAKARPTKLRNLKGQARIYYEKVFLLFCFAVTPNKALKWDARNAGLGLCQRLHWRPLALRWASR